MAILDIQKRGRELGRIRIGATIERGGRKVPTKIESFRFTTPSQRAAETIAEVFGGKAQPWAEHPGQFEVFTDAKEIGVMIPPGHAMSQGYELWSRGGIQRRCDGITQADGNKCICPFDIKDRMAAAATGNACKPMTRLSVILPDVPDLGVWLLSSGGYNAALELAGAAELLHNLAVNDVYLPAVLRLEQRTKVTGGQTHHFGVPVLEIGATLRALVAGEFSAEGGMMLPPPPGVKALEAGHAQPAAPVVDEPAFAAAPDDDIVDAEIVVDADVIAQNTLACESRADVQALVDSATEHKVIGAEVTHPVTGARVVLRDLLETRWRELPRDSQ